MDDREIEVDDRTSSLLEDIVGATDDPLLIAEAARVEPIEFREFISEQGHVLDEDAAQLLKAAESFQLSKKTRQAVKQYHNVRGDNFLKRLTYPGIFVQRIAPLRLLSLLNFGLGISIVYGLLAFTVVYYFYGKPEGQLFFAAYTSSFKTIISLGLIVGAYLIVFRAQDVIPKTIEDAFGEQLPDDYYYYKRQFYSLFRSISFSAEMIVVAFVIFSYNQFPLSKPAENFMLIAVGAEYAFAMYVVRKLTYTAMMVHSLMIIPVKRNLFRKRELDGINPYINVAATLTIVFLCVHIIGYYYGPFLFGSVLGQSTRIFLLFLPLGLTTALLILNFYPRLALAKIYDQSIDVEIAKLNKVLAKEGLTVYEKRLLLIEFHKMARNDLRSHLQLTLGDVPILITVLIMVLTLLLRR